MAIDLINSMLFFFQVQIIHIQLFYIGHLETHVMCHYLQRMFHQIQIHLRQYAAITTMSTEVLRML